LFYEKETGNARHHSTPVIFAGKESIYLEFQKFEKRKHMDRCGYRHWCEKLSVRRHMGLLVDVLKKVLGGNSDVEKRQRTEGSQGYIPAPLEDAHVAAYHFAHVSVQSLKSRLTHMQ
jgi:hypothetical protein